MTTSTKLSILSLFFAGSVTACTNQYVPQAQRSDVQTEPEAAPPNLDTAEPEPEAIAPPPGPVLDEPSAEEPCAVRAVLSRDTLDTATETIFETASIEETHNGEGRLTGRTARWIDAFGVTIKDRVIAINTQGCLGTIQTRSFDDNGLITELSFEVVDEEFAASMMAFQTYHSVTRRWHYDGQGNIAHIETDLNFDGVFDTHIEIDHNGAGQPLRKEVWMEEGFTDFSGNSAFLDQGIGTVETWTYHTSQEVLSYEKRYDEDRVDLHVNTFNSLGQLRTTTQSFNGQVYSTINRTWRLDGKPLSEETRSSHSGVVNKTWSYDDAGRMRSLDSLEDFNGDGRPERHDHTAFDEESNIVLFEQDQPYDGAVDWRETTTFEAGLKVHSRSMNVATGELWRETRWTYDAEGRQLEEHTLSRNGTTEETMTSGYSPEGWVTLQQWLRDGIVTRVLRYTYNALGGRTLMTQDNDADGSPDRTEIQRFDAAGNLLMRGTDHNADGTIDNLHLLYYGSI